MKTEIKNRIQDSGKQDASLGCDSNATSAAQKGTRPAALEHTDPSDRSDMSYPADSPRLVEIPINSSFSVALVSLAHPRARLPTNLSAKASAAAEALTTEGRALIKPDSSFCLHPSSFPEYAPAALTQANPGLAQIHLSYEAQLLSQSDRFRANLSQRLFRQRFRPNLTCHQIRIGLCPLVVDFSALCSARVPRKAMQAHARPRKPPEKTRPQALPARLRFRL
jgi:hypothetical protein